MKKCKIILGWITIIALIIAAVIIILNPIPKSPKRNYATKVELNALIAYSEAKFNRLNRKIFILEKEKVDSDKRILNLEEEIKKLIELEAKLTLLKEENQGLKNQLNKLSKVLYNHIVDFTISQEDYIRLTNEIEEEMADLESRIEKLEKEEKSVVTQRTKIIKIFCNRRCK